MLVADVLLDSNILIYALSDAPSERAKRDTAARLLVEQDFGTSYQVLMETWVMATRRWSRRSRRGKSPHFLTESSPFHVSPEHPSCYQQALALSGRYKIHPYDAAVVAATHELGVRLLYSEDLSNGQEYDGIRVVDPFRQ